MHTAPKISPHWSPEKNKIQVLMHSPILSKNYMKLDYLSTQKNVMHRLHHQNMPQVLKRLQRNCYYRTCINYSLRFFISWQNDSTNLPNRSHMHKLPITVFHELTQWLNRSSKQPRSGSGQAYKINLAFNFHELSQTSSPPLPFLPSCHCKVILPTRSTSYNSMQRHEIGYTYNFGNNFHWK